MLLRNAVLLPNYTGVPMHKTALSIATVVRTTDPKYCFMGSHDSSVDTETGYLLDDPKNWCSILGKGTTFSVLHTVQPCSRTPSASHKMDT
jgi:hypothetical protein